MLAWLVSCQDQRPTRVASSGLPFIHWLRVRRTASRKRALLLLYFEENTNASFRIPFLLSQLRMPGGYRLNFTHSTRTPDGDNGGEDFAGAPILIGKDGDKLHSMECADNTNLTRLLETDAVPENRVGRFLRWVLLGLSRSHAVRHDLRLGPECESRSICPNGVALDMPELESRSI